MQVVFQERGGWGLGEGRVGWVGWLGVQLINSV